RDPRARRAEHAFVVEGPRVLAAALDRGADLESAYVGPGADRAFAPLIARLRDLDIPIEELKDGVLERIGDTVTPQPVLAVPATPRASTPISPDRSRSCSGTRRPASPTSWRRTSTGRSASRSNRPPSRSTWGWPAP